MTDHDELRARVEDAILHHFYYTYLPTKSALSLLDEVVSLRSTLDANSKVSILEQRVCQAEHERDNAEGQLDTERAYTLDLEKARDTALEKLARSRRFSVSLTHQIAALKGAVRRLNNALEAEAKYHHADLKEAAQIEQERNEWKERSKNADARVRRWRNALVDLLDSPEEIV